MVVQMKVSQALPPAVDRPKAAMPKASNLKDQIQKVLAQPIDYIDHEAFQDSDAYSKIFEQAPLLPETDNSWYHPAIDTSDAMQKRNAKIENHVLTAAQEQVIFKQFNYARFRSAKLQEKAFSQLNHDENPQLNARDSRALLHWMETAQRIRAQIVDFNLGLVLAMVKRFDPRNDTHEMLSEGHIILLYSIDKFDISQGYKFSTYACRSILRGMAKVAEKQSVRRTNFIGGFDEGREITEPYDFVDQVTTLDGIARLKEILRTNAADLSELEQKIIHHRFPIEDGENATDGEWMTLRQLGKLLGYTKERVRQLQFSAIEKIRLVMEPELSTANQEEEA